MKLVSGVTIFSELSEPSSELSMRVAACGEVGFCCLDTTAGESFSEEDNARLFDCLSSIWLDDDDSGIVEIIVAR